MYKDVLMEPIPLHGKLKHAKENKYNAVSSRHKIKHSDGTYVAAAQRKWLTHIAGDMCNGADTLSNH